LGGLLKRGILQVLDQPENFMELLKTQRWTTCNELAYLKAVSQWITTLHQSNQWRMIYSREIGDSMFAVKNTISELNTRRKMETATKEHT